VIEAKPGCCGEMAFGSPVPIPCNRPASFMIGWKGRTEKPIRMCTLCADHNISNRSGEMVGIVTLPKEKPPNA
jgi:hypothetical protein